MGMIYDSLWLSKSQYIVLIYAANEILLPLMRQSNNMFLSNEQTQIQKSFI